MPADAEGTLDVNVRHHATLSIKANELEPYALALLADFLRVESDRAKGLQHSGAFLMRVVLPAPGLPMMRGFFTGRRRADP